MEGPVQRRPLKEKLREHWETRDEIWNPKPQKANRMGKIFSWTYAISLGYSVIWVMLPNIAELADSGYLRPCQALACFVLFNVLFNWILTASLLGTQATTDNVPQDSNTGSGYNVWRHCAICQLNVPPRSHHCKICNVCVLKRDHHCFFTGSCVGWANQRRFMVFLYYTVFGNLYGLVVTTAYLTGLQDPWTPAWYNFLPGVSLYQWLVTGAIGFGQFLLLIQMYVAVMVMFFGGGYFIWESFMIWRGQTTYEAVHGIQYFRASPLESFRTVFGSYGLVQFIFPLPVLQDGNGVDWPKYKRVKAT